MIRRLRRRLRLAWLHLVRLHDSPSRIARGGALGLMISVAPFLGLHTPVTVLACFLLDGNQLAGFITAWVGTPLLAWLFFPASIWAGDWLLGTNTSMTFVHELIRRHDVHLLVAFGKAWLLGWLVLGGVFAVGCYPVLRRGVVAFRERRRRKRPLREAPRP